MKVVIPMAGLGSRFSKEGYKDHKPLIKVNGKTLIRYSIETLDFLDHKHIIIIRDLGGNYIDILKEELRSINLDFELVVIDKVTSGATSTVMYARDLVDDDDELIITNCDQYLIWNSKEYLEESRNYDSSILLYKSDNEKNSFAKITNGKVVSIAEKKAISNDALVGVHYWKKAKYFFDSADESVRKCDINRETYISETYNYLIRDNKSVGGISIGDGFYYSTGTPEDLQVFNGLISEYKKVKNNTYFFDLDGTILMHAHKYSNISIEPQLCPGVREMLDKVDSRGDTIILCSARKESARKTTESDLSKLMVPYDQLVLGLSQGCRTIINDVLSADSAPRARSINVISDKGFSVDDI